MSLNQVLLYGNLGQDPEAVQNTKTAITKLRVATTSRTGDRTETEWHNVKVFGKQAELCAKYLAKGRTVFIEGRIHYDSWTDKAGQKRNTVEIIANHVTFVGVNEGRVSGRQMTTESNEGNVNDAPEAAMEMDITEGVAA